MRHGHWVPYGSSDGSSPKKMADVEYIDEYDVETRRWRRVPVVDQDEEEVLLPEKPEKSPKYFRAGIVAVVAIVVALVVSFWRMDTRPVRVDKASPVSVFLTAVNAAGVKVRDEFPANEFKQALRRVAHPLTLTFAVLDDRAVTLVFYRRKDRLFARCSRPTTASCALALNPAPRGAGLLTKHPWWRIWLRWLRGLHR